MKHLMTDHPTYGKVPLCGQAMWESLTNWTEANECWECASIHGVYSKQLQHDFGIDVHGAPA